MKKPLAVVGTVSQGLNGVSHFLNHQKRSIRDKQHKIYVSGAMPIPPFHIKGEMLHTYEESAGIMGDLREFSHPTNP